MKSIFCLLLVLGLLTSHSLADTVVYDSGTGGAGGINFSLVSDLDFPQVVAGAFFIDPMTTITGVEWTGIYSAGASASDDFTINFYDITSGAGPSEILASFDVGNEVNRTESGFDDIYEYSAQIEFNTSDSIKPCFAFISIYNNTT